MKIKALRNLFWKKKMVKVDEVFEVDNKEYEQLVKNKFVVKLEEDKKEVKEELVKESKPISKASIKKASKVKKNA